jgi:protein tyrosine/serine phosphatase
MILRRFIAIILLLLNLTVVYFLYVQKQGNFHTITPGEAYRSAQLNRELLEYYIKNYNIKTVLNLRGEDLSAPWYTEEIQVAKENKLMHYDVALSSTHEPDSDKVKKLMDIFEHAPRPILLHCQGGADRAGLVSAMWKIVVDKEPKSEAEKQLTIVCGHIPLGAKASLDRFFEKWTPPASVVPQNKANR